MTQCSVANVNYISHDKMILNSLSSLLHPVMEEYLEDVTVYIFSEKNIQSFMNSFCELFCGGPSIILVDHRFKHFLNSVLLRVTSEVIVLNQPIEIIIKLIENAIKEKSIFQQKHFNGNDLFNFMAILYHFNDREKMVMGMILAGASKLEISNKINISHSAISRYKLSAMTKMGMNNMVEVQSFLNIYSAIIQRQGFYLFNKNNLEYTPENIDLLRA